MGERNGAALWRQLRKQGFRGSLRVVTEWATRRRKADRTDSGLTRTPAARTIARLLTIDRDWLSKSETVTVATVESGVPLLVEAREIVADFQAMCASAAWMRSAGAGTIESRRLLCRWRGQG